MASYYKLYTAKAPVNIAVIKYWGKGNEKLKVPINGSISGTLNIEEMCATTTVAMSDKFEHDELWLNGKKQDLSDESHAKILLNEIRRVSKLDARILKYKVHIVSYNNFPTAAGLASSAAGYACLAYVLGHTYEITDPTYLSRLARRGSGSACRSLFGGFVEWIKGDDDESSGACQLVNNKHWPEMRVIICVINDQQKDVSSSEGMLRSVLTSQLIKYRAEHVVPGRMESIKKAILDKDFEKFAKITMQDSNQFHAICLDTFPPLFYLNDTSRKVIRICSIINSYYGQNKVAYTFDAGPNACIYLLEDFVSMFINLVRNFFPAINVSDRGFRELEVKGQKFDTTPNQVEFQSISNKLESSGIQKVPNLISYLINTSIGDGPKLIEDHLDDEKLKP